MAFIAIDMTPMRPGGENGRVKFLALELIRRYRWVSQTRCFFGNAINEKAIFIAPRDYEGIGLSFLEAMAMGKAVVGVNNPTMNEYIADGKIKYFFDLDNIKEIDFSN